MRPEAALEAARAAAAEQRAGGHYGDDLSGFAIRVPDRRSQEQLLEWAVIEPDVDLVISTRRWGMPITWLKRAVLHVLRQYLKQLESQQTRFNVHMLVRVAELEDRVADLEDWAGQREEGLFGDGIRAPGAERRRAGRRNGAAAEMIEGGTPEHPPAAGGEAPRT